MLAVEPDGVSRLGFGVWEIRSSGMWIVCADEGLGFQD